MYSRCLVCLARFPENEVLEHLPLGDRVAFDVARGRLWVICGRCHRWSLAPIEARWEALEELDRLTSGEAGASKAAKLLSKTDHASLLEVGPVQVVRIGGTSLEEEAWWRYGRQLNAPRTLDQMVPAVFRRLRYGSVAWRGEKACPGCGFVFTELPFHDRNILIVRPTEAEGEVGPEVQSGGGEPSATAEPTLVRRCPRCRETREGGLHLWGLEAELVLSRVLAYENFTPASQGQITAATRVIEDVGGASALVRLLTRHGRPLGDLPPIGSVALEIYSAEAREKSRLKLQLEELKARWRQEEELAAVIDGELTPEPLLEGLVRRVRGGS